MLDVVKDTCLGAKIGAGLRPKNVLQKIQKSALIFTSADFLSLARQFPTF